MKKFCIFDLDGTLVNTIADITDALNAGLRLYNHPTLTERETEAIVGYSTDYMFQHAVPQEYHDDWKDVGAAYQLHYRAHCCDRSRPYDGILRAVSTLTNAGIRTAVVSNKPHGDAVKVINTLFPRDTFSLVLGRVKRFPAKPAPDALRFVTDYFGLLPEDVVYVGDSEVDAQFAANAGIECIKVSWGYRTREQLAEAGAGIIVDDPEELTELILQL